MSPTRRSISLTLLAAVALSVAPAGLALADDSQPSPAVVGPLLDTAGFGATVGLPTGCQAATGALGSGSSEYGQAGATSGAIDATNAGCDALSTAGTSGVTGLQGASAPLAGANPVVNPALTGSGAAVSSAGGSLPVVGPTVGGLGNTLTSFTGKDGAPVTTPTTPTPVSSPQPATPAAKKRLHYRTLKLKLGKKLPAHISLKFSGKGVKVLKFTYSGKGYWKVRIYVKDITSTPKLRSLTISKAHKQVKLFRRVAAL